MTDKTYKIIFRKKEVLEGSSSNSLNSNLLQNTICDFCKQSWIDVVNISIKDYPKKCYIKVKCSRNLYASLLMHLKTADNMKPWIEVIK